MATAGRRLDPVERLSVKIRSLLVAHLKDILRAEGLPVSGVKQELISRLQAHIQRLANEGNRTAIERIQAIAERGQVTPTSSAAYSSSSPANMPNHASSYPYNRPQNNHMYSSYGSMAPKSSLPIGPLKYKPSPFYTIEQALIPQKELKPRESNRDTVEIELTLSPNVAHQLQTDSSRRIMIYCAADNGLGPYTASDVAFPLQCELKCNGEEIKTNLRGLKNKPGSTRPADITSYVRKKPGYPNKVVVVYALTMKRFYVTINLVKKHSVNELVQKLKSGRVLSKEQVLRDMQSKAEDEDIVATSSVMSLKCPLSTLRMELPTRSAHCFHSQCFDASSFLQLQEQAPTWTCPICNKATPFEALTVDMYVSDIIQSTGRDIEQVTVEPDGKWNVHMIEPATPENSRPSPSDDDDDLVEISDSRVLSLKNELTPVISLNQTPPYSSREQSVASSAARQPSSAPKRPASTVIDLTESDDEDNSSRPSKRPALGQGPNPGSIFGFGSDGYSFQLPPPPPARPGSTGSGSGTFRTPLPPNSGTNSFFNTSI